MEEFSKERRVKLLAQKEKSRAQEKKNASEFKEKPKLIFRSYNPQTNSLKEGKLPKARPEDVGPQIQEHLDSAKDSDIGEINLANLAPRKPDWDLKREIKKKVEKLDRRTEKAIIELIQERLKDGGSGDLVAAVAMADPVQDNDEED